MRRNDRQPQDAARSLQRNRPWTEPKPHTLGQRFVERLVEPVAKDEYGSVGLSLPPFHHRLRPERSILIEQPQAQPDQCHRGGNDHRKKQEAEPARTTSHWE